MAEQWILLTREEGTLYPRDNRMQLPNKVEKESTKQPIESKTIQSSWQKTNVAHNKFP